MAAKISITLPQTDAFVVTDAKGKPMTGIHTINIGPSSDYFLFVQKKSTIGIVPEDALVVTGGIKNYKVALRPAVSMVSMQELESVVSSSEDVAPLLDEYSADAPQFTREDFETPEFKQSAQPAVRNIPKKPTLGKPLVTKPITGGKKRVEHFVTKKILEDVPTSQKTDQCVQTEEEQDEEENGALKQPERLVESPKMKEQQKRKDEGDVLAQSLHVKFSFKEDDFVAQKEGKRLINWYQAGDCDDLEEPEFSFELMMTGEGEEPVFCIDGDYYDSSGRMLSIQQGKGKVICVNGDGCDMNSD
jgi:hypothetical protein